MLDFETSNSIGFTSGISDIRFNILSSEEAIMIWIDKEDESGQRSLAFPLYIGDAIKLKDFLSHYISVRSSAEVTLPMITCDRCGFKRIAGTKFCPNCSKGDEDVHK